MSDPVLAVVTPRIYGPIADSLVIVRGESPNVDWLTPERKWHGSIFEAARFELDEREKAEWWLQREIDAITSEPGKFAEPLEVKSFETRRRNMGSSS